jgi:hypothetical protein
MGRKMYDSYNLGLITNLGKAVLSIDDEQTGLPTSTCGIAWAVQCSVFPGACGRPRTVTNNY